MTIDRASGRGLPRSSPRSVAVALLVLTGCRSEMYEQPRYEPLEPSAFFEDGSSARPLVAGTVPRTTRAMPPAGVPDEVFYTGWSQGKLAESVPFPVDRAVLERGQERFRIYCTPCHGELGDGRGMIVRRGFNPPPPYASEELREAADRPLLRCDDARVRDHVFLRLPDSPARPLGHRGLHPGASVEPARGGRRPAGRGSEPDFRRDEASPPRSQP